MVNRASLFKIKLADKRCFSSVLGCFGLFFGKLIANFSLFKDASDQFFFHIRSEFFVW